MPHSVEGEFREGGPNRVAASMSPPLINQLSQEGYSPIAELG